MSKVKVAGFSVSVDGFGAGPEQSLQDPLGKRGRELHQWFFDTRYFHEMIGKEGGSSDSVDATYAQRAMAGFGAFILGRNMYGPIRGAGMVQTGRAGGEIIRLIMRQLSSSHIMRTRLSRCRVVPRSSSSPTGSTRARPGKSRSGRPRR